MGNSERRYVGIHKDLYGGMTDTGKIIREAWAFGILPEDETCEGWTAQGLETLWQKVQAEWEKYGYRVANLPPELQARYLRIQEEAVRRARAAGWDPSLDDEDE